MSTRHMLYGSYKRLMRLPSTLWRRMWTLVSSLILRRQGLERDKVRPLPHTVRRNSGPCVALCLDISISQEGTHHMSTLCINAENSVISLLLYSVGYEGGKDWVLPWDYEFGDRRGSIDCEACY